MDKPKPVDAAARLEQLARMNLKDLWVLHDQVVELFRVYLDLCFNHRDNREAKDQRLYYARYVRAINNEIAYRRVAGKSWQRPT